MFMGTDPHVRARRIFNMIAPIYGALDHYVKNHFSTAIRHVSKEIPLAGKSVLDQFMYAKTNVQFT